PRGRIRQEAARSGAGGYREARRHYGQPRRNQPGGRVHPVHGRVEGQHGMSKGMDAVFSFARLGALLMKEFIQMRRDRITFAMMLGVPLMQLVLFGYAINLDPKGLPAAVVSAESSAFSRSLTRALENTGYFRIVATPASVEE